ncbi:hypothetical protein EJ04DRAFT_538387 [Polyplosphaeria fusca]|uniref:Uncharacterized protein n=1 Tax=Polyplosphaeria fusca TaxID=682080 RepID=A0A9P4QMP9_9PLEO|nr:hypothetical protein EJ04DRAFT_538387 [Polyplosphaeria fusca]
MALELHIPPCIHNPPHHFHPPPPDKPLRIQIQGPLESIQKLLPHTSWHPIKPFPQPPGLLLASLTHQKLYGKEGQEHAKGTPIGVTFDHLVPADDPDPEILAISIVEVDHGEGAFANKHLLFPVDPAEYTGKLVLAVPKCCQAKKGSQDRPRWNKSVAERDRKAQR